VSRPQRLSDLVPGVVAELAARHIEANGALPAMTAVLDASTRGRRNRANGAAYERKVARYLKTWWPDAVRAVRNTTPDPGDVDGTNPCLWWSVKNCQDERYTEWFAEIDRKAGGRVGLLVVRRRGHADPGRWWCWLRLGDLADLVNGHVNTDPANPGAWVRLELAAAVGVLVAAGLAPLTPP
jgi:hypothetical protein